MTTEQTQLEAAIIWGKSAECYSELATDIAKKSAKWTLSPRQQEVLIKIHSNHLAHAAAKKARLDAGVRAPDGREVVEGKVIKSAEESTAYGPVTKVHLELTSGAKVRGNAPRNTRPVVGQVVTFTATFTSFQRDPSTGYWSRPAGWTTLKAATA